MLRANKKRPQDAKPNEVTVNKYVRTLLICLAIALLASASMLSITVRRQVCNFGIYLFSSNFACVAIPFTTEGWIDQQSQLTPSKQ